MWTAWVGVFLLLRYVSATGPIVQTPLGKIQGELAKSYGNRTYTQFTSVPYAKPPIGPLRFKEPQRPTPWQGIWYANFTSICPVYMGAYLGNEDCLYLNIFVPSNEPANIKNKFPVIFDIHAGAFMIGYGQSYSGPVYAMDRDFILVSINYRLGALGFLSTQDEVVPGNNGLKDQVAALEWVNEYIEYFGGDPNKITIMGLSAGGASVNYHYLSPKSRGLFKNGISVSGVSLNPWALQESPVDKARKLGAALGCTQIKATDLIECMRKPSAKTIVEESRYKLEEWLGYPFSPFGPVVERNCDENAFLTEHPYKILSSGRINDVPWMATVTADEGLYPAAEWLNEDEYLPYLDQHWYELCPLVYDFNYTIPKTDQMEVCDKIKKYYWNGNPIDNDAFKKLTKSLTDRLFAVDIEKVVKMQANRNQAPVYMYRYNYTAEKQNSFAVFYSNKPKQGVCHGDDMMMIYSQFHRGFPFFTMTENDKKMQDILWDFFLSFAETGKPLSGTIVWDPVNNDEKLNYLHIDSPDLIGMRKAKTIANNNFWNSINFEENENLCG